MRLQLFAWIVLLLGAVPSHAGFIYTFDASSYSVAVGGTVDVSVYLTYDGSGSDYLSSPGVVSAGVGLRYTSGSAVAAVVSPSTFGGDITANPTFEDSAGYGPADDPPFSGTNKLAGLNVTQLFDPAVTSSTGSLLLGTFKFTGQAAGSMTLQASRLDPVGGTDQVYFDFPVGAVGDGTIGNGTANFTVTAQAVPEPGAVILLGMALVGVVGMHLRRGRRKQALDIGEDNSNGNGAGN